MTISPPKLLIANRGEIAVRILRTARKMGIPVVGIYTLVDAETPHVTMADESYMIGDGQDPRGYLDGEAILQIAKRSCATMIAPGYGFLSENAAFAQSVEDAGITFLGPTPYQMTSMGLKHEARAVAIKAGVPVVPGSDGVIETLDRALEVAEHIGYPVMLKASAGGGGMGMQVCRDTAELQTNFEATRTKGMTLFKDPSVFLEKYIARARHVEVQIFGNGAGHVVHMGERECSVQRRHQKVIEETPCPLFLSEVGQRTRARMCAAAVALGKVMNYRSAGTVEFVLDDESPEYDFYFLELNARIQVEHPITEVVRPGLDLVELLIRQGLSSGQSLPAAELPQARWEGFDGHSIEARIYCENPLAGFRPSPGRLQHVEWADVGPRGRIETWVKSGTMVTPSYDPMIAKVVVWGADRSAAIKQLNRVLAESKLSGPLTNIHYLREILACDSFKAARVNTVFLDTFPYAPPVIEIIAPGLSTSVQDLPGRSVGLGIPRGGAADMLALQAANVLVGNDPNTEGLEMTMMGSKIKFHAAATIALAGAEMKITIDKIEVPMWETLHIAAGSVLNVGAANSDGIRIYLAIRGGLPTIAPYLGSKSTFAGASLGGYQGRPLFAGDMLDIDLDSARFECTLSIPLEAQPKLSRDWELEVTVSAQWSDEFVTQEGMKALLDAEWTATAASNRSGLRLEGPQVQWARTDGGEGGSHPSNILDQGYAVGALNLNGDTPVLFGVDGPDLGGFANILAVSRASMWKLGQMRPEDKIRFKLITREDSHRLAASHKAWLGALVKGGDGACQYTPTAKIAPGISVANITSSTIMTEADWVIKEAGDEFVILEVGEMSLDVSGRVRIELLERALRAKDLEGIVYFISCVRSTLVHYDPAKMTQNELVAIMAATARSLPDPADVEIPIKIYRLPVVPNDPWTKECIEFYMKSARKEAVYLPDNCAYVNRNNGLGPNGVRDALLNTPWFVIARGFFVMLPLIVPLDPRHRVLGQKYNPSRTRTPDGAIGLAGVIGSIYPIESPGGYQLLGRTLTTWRPWNERPCLVETFDQIEYFEVSEDEYLRLDREYKAGIWAPEVREAMFKMADYSRWVGGMDEEVKAFKAKQKAASEEVGREEAVLFANFLKEKEVEAKVLAANKANGLIIQDKGTPVTAPLAASMWKFYVQPGDVIADDDQRIIELEAMKTSVWVTPGDDTVGKKVLSFAVKEGDAVQPGQVLLYLE